jgi:DNA-directed RNA polymerase sigma subunit (sigma70/sigma32)
LWQRKIASNSRAIKSAIPLYEKYCFFKVSRMQTEFLNQENSETHKEQQLSDTMITTKSD